MRKMGSFIKKTNIMSYDVVFNPPFGMASFTNSVTIQTSISKNYIRKQKIKKIWNL